MAVRLPAFDHLKKTVIIFIALLFTFAILGASQAFAQGAEIAIVTDDPPFLGPPDFPPQAPSVTSTPLGFFISERGFIIICFDPLTGDRVPGCTVTETPSVEFGTGGHPHNGARPAGCLRRTLDEPQSVCLDLLPKPRPTDPDRWVVITRAVMGVSDANGEFRVRYIAPEASGHIHFTLTGTDPSGNTLPTRTFAMDIQITDTLEPLPASGDGFVMQAGTTHPGNNFATTSVKNALINIPIKFRDELAKLGIPPEQVTYTSLSLAKGGLFDLSENWRPPHRSHRFGTDADMLPVTNRSMRVLKRVVEINFSFPVREESPTDPSANHWHLRAR